MPPLPPVPGIVTVVFKFTYSNDLDVLTRFHVGYSGAAPAAADLATYAQAQATHCAVTWASCMHAVVTLTLVTATDIGTATGFSGGSTTTVPGTRAGSELPASTCVLINNKIGRRYRGGKPRNYLPWGVAADLADAQHWSVGSQNAWNTGISNLVSQLQTAAGGFAPTGIYNVSYYQGSTGSLTGTGTPYERGHTKVTLRPGGPVKDLITLLSANIRPGTQRRRLQFSP